MGLTTDKCSLRPITLLPAEQIPTNKDLLKNAFNGWFCYDSVNRFLYISRRKLSERNPGQLYVVIAHCTAHIKTGDLSNDFSPNFRIEFYKILSEISEYIFFARTNPKVRYPDEYSVSSEMLQYTTSEIKSIFTYEEPPNILSISDELGSVNYDLAMARRNGKEASQLEQKQAKLQTELKKLRIVNEVTNVPQIE